jgi:hypothetical protein
VSADEINCRPIYELVVSFKKWTDADRATVNILRFARAQESEVLCLFCVSGDADVVAIIWRGFRPAQSVQL